MGILVIGDGALEYLKRVVVTPAVYSRFIENLFFYEIGECNRGPSEI
jgi:hypothetical protein